MSRHRDLRGLPVLDVHVALDEAAVRQLDFQPVVAEGRWIETQAPGVPGLAGRRPAWNQRLIFRSLQARRSVSQIGANSVSLVVVNHALDICSSVRADLVDSNLTIDTC